MHFKLFLRAVSTLSTQMSLCLLLCEWSAWLSLKITEKWACLLLHTIEGVSFWNLCARRADSVVPSQNDSTHLAFCFNFIVILIQPCYLYFKSLAECKFQKSEFCKVLCSDHLLNSIVLDLIRKRFSVNYKLKNCRLSQNNDRCTYVKPLTLDP